MTRRGPHPVTCLPSGRAAGLSDIEGWDWAEARRWCRRVALRYADAVAADDIAQEAVLRAWRARRSCRDPGRPWSWLAQITRHEASRYASRRREEPIDPPEPSEGAEELGPVLERLAVDHALSTLGELDRLLLRLHYDRDLSVDAIANMCGITPSAVKVRMHRARAALRGVL